MAGAGFKDFQAGEILTAADVDNYLMQQTIMVFADAAARTTALTGVVAEGMFSYLKSDDTLYQYNGTAWEVPGPQWLTDYPTNTPELAAESSGQVLMTLGSLASPSWQHLPTQNYIINGAFDVWQRGTSFTSNSAYTADRWRNTFSAGTPTVTASRQALTAGDISAIGYGEGQFFYRHTITTISDGTDPRIEQYVEDVRTLAGQTVTVSFWAKADSSSSQNVQLVQSFGSGGSTSVSVQSAFTVGTIWNRYAVTLTLPAITGKTIGAESFLAVRIYQRAANGSVLDIWGVQLEAGSIATPFKRHLPSLQGELAACQRYYYRLTPGDTSRLLAVTSAESATVANGYGQFPVSMRITPTALEQTGTATDYAVRFVTTTTTCSAVPTFGSATTMDNFQVDFTVASGLTAGQAGRALTNSASGFLGWSAEL